LEEQRLNWSLPNVKLQTLILGFNKDDTSCGHCLVSSLAVLANQVGSFKRMNVVFLTTSTTITATVQLRNTITTKISLIRTSWSYGKATTNEDDTSSRKLKISFGKSDTMKTCLKASKLLELNRMMSQQR